MKRTHNWVTKNCKQTNIYLVIQLCKNRTWFNCFARPVFSYLPTLLRRTLSLLPMEMGSTIQFFSVTQKCLVVLVVLLFHQQKETTLFQKRVVQYFTNWPWRIDIRKSPSFERNSRQFGFPFVNRRWENIVIFGAIEDFYVS